MSAIDEAEVARVVPFLCALAEHGVAPDVQELLIQGNPARGIRPGALVKALARVRNDALEEAATVADGLAKAWGTHERANAYATTAAAIRTRKDATNAR